MIASSDVSHERFAELINGDFIRWVNATPGVMVEVEQHEQGDAYLLVALPGIGIGDDGLDRLQAATERMLLAF